MNADFMQKVALMPPDERARFFDELDKIRHSAAPPPANPAHPNPTSATMVSGSAVGTLDTRFEGISTEPVSNGVFLCR